MKQQTFSWFQSACSLIDAESCTLVLQPHCLYSRAYVCVSDVKTNTKIWYYLFGLPIFEQILLISRLDLLGTVMSDTQLKGEFSSPTICISTHNFQSCHVRCASQVGSQSSFALAFNFAINSQFSSAVIHSTNKLTTFCMTLFNILYTN